MPTISAVVLSYRQADALVETLQALRAQTRPPDEILVVDNGTPETDLAPARAAAPEAAWIVFPGNRGYTGGMNAGLARAKGDLVLFICDDVRPEPGCLQALAGVFDGGRAGLACGCHVAAQDPGRALYCGGEIHLGPWPRLEVWTSPRGETPYETGYATGAAVMARRDLMGRLGGFDPAFFMYWEDVDLSLRVRREGWKILCVPAARLASRTSGRDVPSRTRAAVVFHASKNLLLLMARHAGPKAFLAFLPRFYGPQLIRRLREAPAAALRAALWPLAHPWEVWKRLREPR